MHYFRRSLVWQIVDQNSVVVPSRWWYSWPAMSVSRYSGSYGRRTWPSCLRSRIIGSVHCKPSRRTTNNNSGLTSDACWKTGPPSSSDLYLSSSPNMMATSSLVLYCSASCDTDMAGHEHHHRWHYYAILVDDLLLPSWLDHKTTSKIVHQLRHKI